MSLTCSHALCIAIRAASVSCILPVSFGDNVIGDSTADPTPECINGYPLFPGAICDVTCENGPPADLTSIPGTYQCSGDFGTLSAPSPELLCPSRTRMLAFSVPRFVIFENHSLTSEVSTAE